MLGFTFNPQKRFAELGEREILALAITLEEEDGRIYRDFAEGLRATYPASAKVFDDMAEEESGASADADRAVPRAVRRAHPAGPARGRARLRAPPADLADAAAWASRRCAGGPRSWSRRRPNFYREAAEQVTDAGIRKLLVDLAEIEADHASIAASARGRQLPQIGARRARRRAPSGAVRAAVSSSPGLAGLMDGSVSTLAPVFAAAFATGRSWDAFLVGMAASIGAGISMGFAEALSDDGSITGRGHPWMRGLVCGADDDAGRDRPHAARS